MPLPVTVTATVTATVTKVTAMPRSDPSTLGDSEHATSRGRSSVWPHPVLDQRLSLTVRRRSHCWQLRGNIGRWCGPRISLGYFRDEGLARQFGVLIGRGLAASGLAKWWTPLDVWRRARNDSPNWKTDKGRKPLEALCPL